MTRAHVEYNTVAEAWTLTTSTGRVYFGRSRGEAIDNAIEGLPKNTTLRLYF
jgi:hypothetical protein